MYTKAAERTKLMLINETNEETIQKLKNDLTRFRKTAREHNTDAKRLERVHSQILRQKVIK